MKSFGAHEIVLLKDTDSQEKMGKNSGICDGNWGELFVLFIQKFSEFSTYDTECPLVPT